MLNTNSLDMSNSHHQNLRRMLAEIIGKHANALTAKDWHSAWLYSHMVAGMQRFCLRVLKDAAAFAFCSQVYDHLFSMECAARREVGIC